MSEQVLLSPAPMCQMHQRLLLSQTGVDSDGPWMSCIICVSIALFQGTAAKDGVYDKLGGDINRIGELGCLACYSPDVFGEAVDAYIRGGIAEVKELGERLVREVNARNAEKAK